MESSQANKNNLSQMQDSLDYLQKVLVEENYSTDALLRLSKALKTINEEIDVLKCALNMKAKS